MRRHGPVIAQCRPTDSVVLSKNATKNSISRPGGAPAPTAPLDTPRHRRHHYAGFRSFPQGHVRCLKASLDHLRRHSAQSKHWFSGALHLMLQHQLRWVVEYVFRLCALWGAASQAAYVGAVWNRALNITPLCPYWQCRSQIQI